jgi:tetratricopeptide (TPR) repeat protein
MGWMRGWSIAKGENEKALSYNNLALSVAGNLDNDSAKVTAYASMGDTYMAMNEKLLAFRNYLEGLNIAESSKNEDLIRGACWDLRGFYAGIGEYDKAIDYEMRVITIDRKNHDRFGLLNDYNDIGGLFTAKKQYELALKMYESSIAEADTLHFDLVKVNAYGNIFSMYFSGDQYAKGMTYLNENKELLDFVDKAGDRFIIDEAYGIAYTNMKKFDSAYYYFKRTEPDIEKRESPFMKDEFYEKFGTYYRKKGENGKAIAYYLKAREIGEATRNLGILQKSTAVLDSLYGQAGDYKSAYFYNTEYNKYTDSIKSLSKETDLLKLEVESDNRRRERLVREEEENTQHRHNVQYMGFTVGLVGLFVALVMLGFFVVSPRTIRALGFFSFIFLFEFIILLADKQIHEATHGEPWKVLLIKVGLAAILLPLHHWLEHKVIHYLTSRRKISPAGVPFLRKRSKKEEALPTEAAE